MNPTQYATILDEFTGVEKIHISEKIVVYRGLRKTDSKPVILKTLRSDIPKPEHIEALKHEYSLLTHLQDVKGVNQACDLLYHPSMILVEEDNGGISLKEYMSGNHLTVDEFLNLAIQIVDILAEIHRHHVIHKDINPSNLIIQMDSKEIKFIDFALASQLEEETQEEINPHQLEGTLNYIAPERTGRMNRPFDYRSDFYSLGVTFYEMLTNKLPFESRDPLELIYDHLAKIPPQIPDIPKSLSQLIAKLMEKNPDNRYTSALGIKADLMKCKEGIEFTIGSNDVLDQFRISHKLYGREEEVNDILEDYRDVTQGAIKLLLISGYSGIGKTSLVREVHKPMAQNKGFFISGKFDQLQQSIPYYGFVQSFSHLIHQLLSEPEKKLVPLRQEILEAVGRNGQVIIEIIPDLELLIGKQPPVPTLAAENAQNRFIFAFQSFVHVFAKSEHPLVIFLDDLQWVDSGSLKLIETILTDSNMKFLFMLGAYRDNEVDALHPFIMTVEELRKSDVSIHTINLKPLKKEDTAQLINDSFSNKAFDTEKLTQAIYEKTLGNPFFISQFLKLLYREHVLSFNYQQLAWEIDLEKIKVLGITDNVVDLMIQNIQKLPQNAQDLLILASCIGHSFDLHTLSVISEKTPNEIKRDLWEPLQEGLIAGVNYKPIALEDSNLEQEGNIDYKFVHDRIQQAAYSLIPVEKREQKHLAIGRLLLKAWQKEPKESQLSTIMNHFRECLPFITDDNEKKELASLFLKVGDSAKSSTAYPAALNYYNAGSALLEPPDWNHDYHLLFDIYREKAESEYLTGQLDNAEQQFHHLLTKVQNRLDKSKLYYVMMSMYMNLGQHDMATKAGIANLQLYHSNLSEKPSKAQIILEKLKVEWLLRNKNIENLDTILPPMTDPDQLQITKTLAQMRDANYQYDQDLFTLAILRRFKLFLQYGYSAYSSEILAAASAIYIARNDIEKAKKLVTLNEKLETKLDQEYLSKKYVAYGFFINHYINPLSTNIEWFNRGYKKSLESGELNWACYALVGKVLVSSQLGMPLDELLIEIEKANKFCNKIKRVDFIEIMHALNAVARYLCGEIQIDNAQFEKLYLTRTTKNKTANALTVGEALALSFYLNNAQKTMAVGEDFFNNHQGYLTNIYIQSYLFVLYALSIFDCLQSSSPLVQNSHKSHLKQIMKKVTYWGNQCPVNYKHQTLLLQAEQAKLNKNEKQAIHLYNQAIDAAQTNDFFEFAALINERLAKYYLELKETKVAKTYIQEAYHFYERWGAKRKLKEFEEKYPQWLTTIPSTTSVSISSTTGTENLDLLSISKATQAISEEIVLDKLLTRIVHIVLENAAAHRVVILQGLPLRILAEGTQEAIKVYPDQGIEPTADSFPLSISSYVLRTKKPVILQDVAKESKSFQQDPYLINHTIKSILCAPISYQSKIMGILYLENNLLTHAFTEERLNVLNVLSSQAAISLENARLYAATERFVPIELMQQLNISGIINVQLGDQVQCTMTVLFCDIRNFTTMSESMTSQQTFDFLNVFLGIMEPIITKHYGFIDKYIGDAIMALFPREADDALQAAIEMIKNVPPNIKIGVGINTGDLMLGFLGGKRRMEGTVIGDTVNVASRVESLTKAYSISILITEHTKQRLKRPLDHFLRVIDESASVKGKSIKFSISEVCDTDPPNVKAAKIKTLNQFNQALQALTNKNYGLAKELFENILAINPDDTVAAYYLKNLAA